MKATVTYAELAERVRRAPARVGSTRLVCVDGPAGSGKTTIANRLAHVLDGAAVLHVDDVYEGWTGLDGVASRLDDEVLGPLREGRGAAYRTWDWARGRWGRDAHLDPPDVLLLEGCGAGDRLLAAYASLLVWVEAPGDVRLERGIARDGEALRGEWLRWRELENRHFVAEATRERADLRVDGAHGAADALVLL